MESHTIETLFTKMSIVASSSLGMLRSASEHPVIKGLSSENYWINTLQEYLPIKYGIHSGQIIDSSGANSNQIDIIVYDRETFPYVFKKNGVFLIPVESVVCIFEVKQDIKGKINYIADKIESVRNLCGSYLDVDGNEWKGCWPPRPILGGVLSTDSSYSKNILENKLSELKGHRTIDIGCCANAYSFFVNYGLRGNDISNYGARKNPKVHIYKRDTAYMVFIFQLIHLLQRIAIKQTSFFINIDAYLRAVDAEIVQSAISTPLF